MVEETIRRLERFILYAIILVLIVVVVLSQLHCAGESERIVVTGPEVTRVTTESEGSHYPGVHVIAELEIGDTVKILNYEYLKDCMIYKVLMKDGRKGWVTLGDNCEWVDLNKQRHGSTSSP